MARTYRLTRVAVNTPSSARTYRLTRVAAIIAPDKVYRLTRIAVTATQGSVATYRLTRIAVNAARVTNTGHWRWDGTQWIQVVVYRFGSDSVWVDGDAWFGWDDLIW